MHIITWQDPISRQKIRHSLSVKMPQNWMKTEPPDETSTLASPFLIAHVKRTRHIPAETTGSSDMHTVLTCCQDAVYPVDRA